MTKSFPKREVAELVDAIYAHGSGLDAWARGVVEAARIVDEGAGVAFILFRTDEGARELVHATGRGDIIEARPSLLDVTLGVDPITFRRLYFPRQKALLASELRDAVPRDQVAALDAALAPLRAHDVLGLVGHPGSSHAFAFSVPRVRPEPLRPAARRLLARLMMHAEVGLAMQLGCAEVVAVLTPTGLLAHASGDAGEVRARQALREHVARIEGERAERGANKGADAHDLLSAWSALVEGRWALAQRVDSDGRRYYVAVEVPDPVRKPRAWSSLERRVVELALSGMLLKQIAHALAVSEAFASEALSAAAQKVGLKSRSELLHVAGLLQGGDPLRDEAFTTAERDVLRRLRDGHTNAEIARLRGTSERTIANQVASILRKAGAGSRRGLIARFASDEARASMPEQSAHIAHTRDDR